MLISIDTLRADHLGSYGYARETSPRLDAFAAKSTRYANALAPAPWTLPSHVAMLTGVHPYLAGVRNLRSRIDPAVSTVAELLRTASYQTAAFVDSAPGSFVGAQRGFGRGFDVYRHAPHGPDEWRQHDIANTVRVARDWMTSIDRSRPYFLFLHTKSVHSLREDESRRIPARSPYDAPDPFRWKFEPDRAPTHSWAEGPDEGARYLKQLNRRIAAGERLEVASSQAALSELIARYDAGIAYVDHHIGLFLDWLADSEHGGNTITIVTADHGEGFLEHRFFLHKELHREIVQVPLLIHRSDAPIGRVVAEPVSLEDIVPTMLFHARVAIPAAITGAALAVEQGRPSNARPLFAAAKRASDEFYEAFSLRQGRWTLIRDRVEGQPFSRRLYDSSADPMERDPVKGEEERAAAMEEMLLEWYARAERVEPGASEMELGEDTIDELKALGYIE